MSVAAAVGERRITRTGMFTTAILCVLTLALLVFFHVGFQASDDAEYLTGALGWIEQFPYVGDTHWTRRHTITIPTAVFILLLGLNETAVSLSNILFFLAFLGVNAWFMREQLSGTAAAFATALLVVLPGFTVVATYLNPDVPELFFVSTVFWLLVTARKNPERHATWALIGALLGAAFVTRQTALAAVLFVAALCVFRPAVPRSRYFLSGVAFLIVVAADWVYLTAMTGDPLYRLSGDFHHDRVDRLAEAARLASSGGLLDFQGNLSVNVFLDPLLALFVTQKYALLFWLLLPASMYAWRRRSLAPSTVLALAAGLGIAYFLFVAINPKLYLVPRYLIVVAWCASIIVGWWLADLWTRDRRLAAVILSLAVLAGFVALLVENTNPRFAERQLLAWVARHPNQPVYTDLETAIRARYYFRFSGQSMDAVRTERPPPGATVLHSADRVRQCEAMPRCKDRASDFKPTTRWISVQSLEAPPTLIGRLIRAAGFEALVHRDISKRLFAPGGRVTVYQVDSRE
jgi:4-amino-4-deoxy-L-arabinose transferase-like glycosyltransferase